MPNENPARVRRAKSQSRIMVVDDEVGNREVISEILSSSGYEVVTAQDGLDALKQLVEPLPDVIISDLNMPRMSGVEFLEVVRQKYPEVPLIAISGEFRGCNVPPGVAADAYLEKGAFSFAQLRTKITNLLAASPRSREPSAI